MSGQPQVVFAHTLKALLSQVFERRGLLTPALRADLAALAVDPDKPRDLSIDQWWQVVALGARQLAPEAPDSKAFFELGHQGLRGHRHRQGDAGAAARHGASRGDAALG